MNASTYRKNLHKSAADEPTAEAVEDPSKRIKRVSWRQHEITQDLLEYCRMQRDQLLGILRKIDPAQVNSIEYVKIGEKYKILSDIIDQITKE